MHILHVNSVNRNADSPDRKVSLNFVLLFVEREDGKPKRVG
jgi:hypothetical protein